MLWLCRPFQILVILLLKNLFNIVEVRKQFLKHQKKTLQSIDGIGTVIINALQHSNTLKIAEKELEFIQKNDIQAYYFDDADYPYRLKHCID